MPSLPLNCSFLLRTLTRTTGVRALGPPASLTSTRVAECSAVSIHVDPVFHASYRELLISDSNRAALLSVARTFDGTSRFPLSPFGRRALAVCIYAASCASIYCIRAHTHTVPRRPGHSRGINARRADAGGTGGQRERRSLQKDKEPVAATGADIGL